MNTTLISAIVAAAIGAAGAWYVQEHRIDTLLLEQQDERISIQRAARTSLERTLSRSSAAQSAAASRAVVLRKSADDARGELDSLQHATDAALRAAAQSADASLAAATTATGLLNQCAAEYQALGERCDRHVNDIKTLTEAWPK